MSEREFTCLVVRSVGQSFLPSLGCRLLFVFPLTNAQLDLTKSKMLSDGSANNMDCTIPVLSRGITIAWTCPVSFFGLIIVTTETWPQGEGQVFWFSRYGDDWRKFWGISNFRDFFGRKIWLNFFGVVWFKLGYLGVFKTIWRFTVVLLPCSSANKGQPNSYSMVVLIFSDSVLLYCICFCMRYS